MTKSWKIKKKAKTKHAVWDDLGPESRQKKSYEQLRPRSIDWSCQMVSPGTGIGSNQN